MTLIAFLPVLVGCRPTSPSSGPRRRSRIRWSSRLSGRRSAPPSSRSSASSCPGSSSATSASRRPIARSSSTARTTPDAPIRRRSGQLFANVRHNYFRLYFHYMYFNVARIFYLQTDNVFRYMSRADDRRRRDYARPDEPDPQRLRPGALLLPVPGQFLDDDRRAAVDLQAPEGLRGEIRGEPLPKIDRDYLARRGDGAEPVLDG